MFCIVQCESFTRNSVAPPSAAPSMAAFTSSSSSRRPISYSPLGPSTWPQSTMPAVPSMSVEMKTRIALPPLLADPRHGIDLDQHAVEQEPARDDRGRGRIGRRERIVAGPLERVVVGRAGQVDVHLDDRRERRALLAEHGVEVRERLPDLGLGVVGVDDGAVLAEPALSGREDQLALGDDRLGVLVLGGERERVSAGAVHGRADTTHMADRDAIASIEELHRRLEPCRLCVKAGIRVESMPVFSHLHRADAILVGQAPGIREAVDRRPFIGPAGRRLRQWLEPAGLGTEEAFYGRLYIAAVAKCFPGKRPGGSDVRPSAAMVRTCRPWLLRELELVDAPLVVAVGTLALAEVAPGVALEDAVGVEL